MRCEQELYWQNYTVTLAKIKIRKLSANHHEFIKKFNIKIQNFFRKFVRCRLVSLRFLPIFLDFLKIFDYLWNVEFIFLSYYINVCRWFESSMRHDIEWNFFSHHLFSNQGSLLPSSFLEDYCLQIAKKFCIIWHEEENLFLVWPSSRRAIKRFY